MLGIGDGVLLVRWEEGEGPPEPVQPEDPREYFETIMLGAHLDRLPTGKRGPFVDRVVAELGTPVTVNYVRLTMSARRPEGT